MLHEVYLATSRVNHYFIKTDMSHRLCTSMIGGYKHPTLIYTIEKLTCSLIHNPLEIISKSLSQKHCLIIMLVTFESIFCLLNIHNMLLPNPPVILVQVAPVYFVRHLCVVLDRQHTSLIEHTGLMNPHFLQNNCFVSPHSLTFVHCSLATHCTRLCTLNLLSSLFHQPLSFANQQTMSPLHSTVNTLMKRTMVFTRKQGNDLIQI